MDSSSGRVRLIGSAHTRFIGIVRASGTPTPVIRLERMRLASSVHGLSMKGCVQSVGRCRLIARRSPTDESMAAIPEPIIVPTMTSPG